MLLAVARQSSFGESRWPGGRVTVIAGGQRGQWGQ